MLKLQSIILIFGFLVCLALSDKSLSITCSTCTSNQCASGYCYTLEGDDFTDTVCVKDGDTCDLTINQTLTMMNCSYDYSSTKCSTGVCFAIANEPIALLGGNCSTPYTQNYSCGQCVATICAGNLCQVYNKSTQSGQTVSCIDGCPTTNPNHISVAPCAGGQDSLGASNNCCMTFSTVNSPICSTQSVVLTSTKLQSWVKGSGEYYVTTILMSVLLFFLGLYI